MHALAAKRIAELGLATHPEGGHYREVFRSTARVQPLDLRPVRMALTTIYFLLAEGEVSRWHRVDSDEIWHFYEGDPLELFIADAGDDTIRRVRLGALDEGADPVVVVPAHAWQAARPTGAYTLAGCTVGPGFEFADFTLLRDMPGGAAWLQRHDAEFAQFL